MNKLFSLLIVLLAAFPVFAQESKEDSDGQYLLSASGPRGNYIFLYRGRGADTSMYSVAGILTVERTALDSAHILSGKKPKADKLGEVQAVQSKRDLHSYYSEAEIQELLKLYSLTTEEELLQKIQVQRAPNNYDIAYTDIRMQQALGHVFLDATAEIGKTYLYKIFRTDAGGSKLPWAYAYQTARANNAGLFQYRAVPDSVMVSDSLVMFNWKYDLTRKEIPGRKPAAGDVSNNDEYLVNPANLRLRTYVLRNGKLEDSKLYLGLANQKEDKVVVMHAINTRPEEEIMAFTVLEDEIGNRSAFSDTVYTTALSYNNAPIVISADVKEVTDGLRISWPQLPEKRYISGIKIQRLGGEGSTDEVTDIIITSPRDTSFIDYTAQVGYTYRYLVSTAFAKGVAFQQRVPAVGAGTLAKFSKPVPPRNLRIANEGKNIRIDWDSSISKGFFGYHVYRSFDGGPMELVAGPVKTNSYTDTAAHLSGRTIYTYAVQTQNLMQDTSILSDVVSITPQRAVVINGPVTVSTYYANGQLQLSWDDARKNDSYITGYQLERRQGNAAFAPFGAILTNPFAVDSGIRPGTVYQYRVAALGPGGERSEYTNAAQFELPAVVGQTTVDPTTRNTDQGVEISWTALQIEGQKDFGVYRRVLPEGNYRLIGTVAPGASEFTDKDTREGENYIYVVTFRYSNGTEGPQGLPSAQVFHKQAPAQP